MSANPWHRRYHSDALAGMLSLTLEERGAYQTVLDLIYDRGGPIADNERLLAGYMGCSTRKWKSIRAALIEKGKLIAADGVLSNFRAEKEIENDAKTRRKLAENGSKGGRKRAERLEKSNENNETDIAPLENGSSLRARSISRSQSIPSSNEEGPDDPGRQFWDSAKGYLGKSKASLIGKLAGEYGRDAVATAITTAMLTTSQPPDRVSYVIGILKRSRADSEEFTGFA